MLKVSCTISSKDIITYILKKPIVEQIDYNLYKWISVPTKTDLEYITILPKVKHKEALEIFKEAASGGFLNRL